MLLRVAHDPSGVRAHAGVEFDLVDCRDDSDARRADEAASDARARGLFAEWNSGPKVWTNLVYLFPCWLGGGLPSGN